MRSPLLNPKSRQQRQNYWALPANLYQAITVSLSIAADGSIREIRSQMALPAYMGADVEKLQTTVIRWKATEREGTPVASELRLMLNHKRFSREKQAVSEQELA